VTDALHDLVYVVAVLPALIVARRYRQLPPAEVAAGKLRRFPPVVQYAAAAA
jgi:hypothetical protein